MDRNSRKVENGVRPCAGGVVQVVDRWTAGAAMSAYTAERALE